MKKQDRSNLMYLDTYLWQKDRRVRLPKQIEYNLNVQKGLTLFDIYLDNSTKEIVLKIKED